jgi:hypothetical protein
MRKSILLLFLLLLAAWSLSGVARAESNARTEVSFDVILDGDFGPFYDGPTDLVIRNERQWCRFWDLVHGIRTEPPPCDQSLVDFRREVVVASSRPGVSGCYSTDIERIETERWHRRGIRRKRSPLKVFVQDTVPGSGCSCAQSLVFPAQAVVVAKPVGRVRFIHETVTLDCSEFTFPR